MDYITTDIASLEAEIAAIDKGWAATSERLDVLLAEPPVLTTVAGQLAGLRELAAEHSAALDAIEAEQAAIAAQLDDLELESQP